MNGEESNEKETEDGWEDKGEAASAAFLPTQLPRCTWYTPGRNDGLYMYGSETMISGPFTPRMVRVSTLVQSRISKLCWTPRNLVIIVHN